MPRPVCVKCLVEMQVEKPVNVQFNALVTQDHGYQTWMGDLARCPVCKVEIVTRWGLLPLWSRHEGQALRPPADLVIEERRHGK